jgi:signal transduction histidine kinase/DNA-binding response OmpR family regulator
MLIAILVGGVVLLAIAAENKISILFVVAAIAILTVKILRELYLSIAKRANELIEIRQLDRMKSEFISTVSHELRTPLTSIGGYVKLISAGDAGPITDTQQEFLSIIETNVDRLTGLINDILDVEKLESGKFQLLKEPQDLKSILRECRESLLLLAHQKGLELRLRIPDRIASVLGERARLVQIFNNLISNAIKYTTTGFVEIEIVPKGYAVLVRIRDSGIGMTPDEQNKLFQKFYRTDAGLASKEKGTGLGLLITRGLVEAHGGTISVESGAGKGSVFTVSLPVMNSVFSVEEMTQDKERTDELVWAMQNVEESKEDELLRAPKALWIVDPNPKDAESMRRLIEKGNPAQPTQNFKTRIFYSIRDVPQLAEGEPTPAVVIVDPASLGGEVQSLTDLRWKLRVTVPVLVVSESVDTAVAFAEGASALITKPIGDREFWIAIQDLLSNRGRRVLVADANTDFRILIKRSLEQRGFKVDDVDRGKLVMGRLDHEHYDLLLIDLGFPDVSGMELLKAVRKRAQFNQIPFFLMFGGTEPIKPDDLQSVGDDRFIGKDRGIEGIVDLVMDELMGSQEGETVHGSNPAG